MTIYKQVVKIQELIWQDDDCIEQENLFEVQELIAKLALDIATKEHKVEELVKQFPYLYELKGESK